MMVVPACPKLLLDLNAGIGKLLRRDSSVPSSEDILLGSKYISRTPCAETKIHQAINFLLIASKSDLSAHYLIYILAIVSL